jgi:hypothetical protein
LVTLVVPSGPLIFVVSWTSDFSEHPVSPKPTAAVNMSARSLVVRIFLPSSIEIAGTRPFDTLTTRLVTSDSGGLAENRSKPDASSLAPKHYPGESSRGISLAIEDQAF